MASVSVTRATLDDLYRTEGKAELIGGRIFHFMASGFLPSRVAGNVFISLHLHAKSVKQGEAFWDGIGFAVPELPNGRESFSPDASFYTGSLPADRMRFIDGPPTFAVEVRSENDYGDSAESEMALIRADYFAAGTLVVWDVDPRAEIVTVYQATTPAQPQVFRRGEQADAEPAVPGWRMAVSEVFAL
jgi:Uma2 family endonuclease